MPCQKLGILDACHLDRAAASAAKDLAEGKVTGRQKAAIAVCIIERVIVGAASGMAALGTLDQAAMCECRGSDALGFEPLASLAKDAEVSGTLYSLDVPENVE